jgi:hypothetical protein
MVFARSYCRGLLLSVVLVDAYECEPPLFDVCLPCDIYILGGFSRCFFRVFLVSFSLFGLGVVRALSLRIFGFLCYIIYICLIVLLLE